MNIAIHPDHLPGLKERLQHIEATQADLDQVRARRAAIAERLDVLRGQVAAASAGHVPLYDAPAEDRVEQLVAGADPGMTDTEESRRRREHNRTVGFQVDQLRRDVDLLEHEDARCAAREPEVQKELARARVVFANAATQSIMAAWAPEAERLIECIFKPVRGCNVVIESNYAGAGFTHSPGASNDWLHNVKLFVRAEDAPDRQAFGRNHLQVWPIPSTHDEVEAAFDALVEQVRSAKSPKGAKAA